MPQKFVLHKENYFASLQHDLPAGLVVFLISIPLCLGIASASGSPFFAGILGGIIGALIIPLFSKSQLTISGPTTALVVVILGGIQTLGSFQAFLVAVFLAGIFQILLGILRAAYLAYYIPSSVIRGMLAAIGLLLILKQLPHALGYDIEIFEDEKFFVNDQKNTFTLLLDSLGQIEPGALIISMVSIALILLSRSTALRKLYWLPPALVLAVLGVIINESFVYYSPQLKLEQSHLITLPIIATFTDFLKGFSFPDWSFILNKETWIVAFSLCLISYVKTSLIVEAVDKLDPYKRKTPLNQALIAHGIGNTIAGLIGAIPITAAIVRSSASVGSGARTKTASFSVGIFLLLSLLFFTEYLNKIPLACLAAILLHIGYKLAKPKVFIEAYRSGWNHFVPFISTIIAIIFTDLLPGVGIGLAIGLLYIVRSNFQSAFFVTKDKKNVLIRFKKDVSFLNKPLLLEALESIEENSYLIIDASRALFIDNDIVELIEEFKEEANLKNITIEFKNFRAISNYQLKTKLSV